MIWFQIYLYLPGELMRVTPVLLVSAFPFAQNVAFPLAMMYPNHLLSSHFYNENQQSMAYHGKIVRRQSHYRLFWMRLRCNFFIHASFQKLSIIKECAPRIIFFNEKVFFRKIQIILDLEKWLESKEVIQNWRRIYSFM